MSKEDRRGIDITVNVNGGNGRNGLERCADPEYEEVQHEADRVQAEASLLTGRARLEILVYGKFKPLEEDVKAYAQAVTADPSCIYVCGLEKYAMFSKIEAQFEQLSREQNSQAARTTSEQQIAEQRRERLRQIGEQMDAIRQQEINYGTAICNMYRRDAAHKWRKQLHEFIGTCIAIPLVLGGALLFGKISYDNNISVGYAVDQEFTVGQKEPGKLMFEDEATKKDFIAYAEHLLEPHAEVFKEFTGGTWMRKAGDGIVWTITPNHRPPLFTPFVSGLGYKMNLADFQTTGKITRAELNEARSRIGEYQKHTTAQYPKGTVLSKVFYEP